ncbi:MAG: hypothetical protein UT86_C0007G0018 [Candidatus Magasanikbacteria bacterium GW2011_GWC2_40_17]|uniref:Uncharacterized protein n=1 Tax=Candidatus Magasanikbacteria bacterium GW2011_GWA2_42_32 TaxID=1619039 RepID=A0A0G1A5Y9_9BACT|nr:MAG: hypothetical protein UT86_C0007G0018 [Candidatus Magasanikbacteria bacterium GW2011_GWC2_40_17]KKS56477.1 MAG: hypothetical protein UV20_C0011G0018 [Candidatus Magasanikbacteria bacterium GW2011_GWA2_42_32]OGH85062.1 MAG: hypothetical protein A2294_01575 [Candidatus Magasanikbacteria bacterium RIFOXYB2_FULL_38_10]
MATIRKPKKEGHSRAGPWHEGADNLLFLKKVMKKRGVKVKLTKDEKRLRWELEGSEAVLETPASILED